MYYYMLKTCYINLFLVILSTAENVDLTDTVKTILRILNESDLKDQRLTGLKLLELAGKHKNQTGKEFSDEKTRTE